MKAGGVLGSSVGRVVLNNSVKAGGVLGSSGGRVVLNNSVKAGGVLGALTKLRTREGGTG